MDLSPCTGGILNTLEAVVAKHLFGPQARDGAPHRRSGTGGIALQGNLSPCAVTPSSCAPFTSTKSSDIFIFVDHPTKTTVAATSRLNVIFSYPLILKGKNRCPPFGT
jgi:hypothetical protein